MRLDLSIRNEKGFIANLHSGHDRIVSALERTIEVNGKQAYAFAHRLCPKRSNFMANNLRLEFTEKKRVWELGWDSVDFESAGVRFYPPYVEYGTIKAPAQPVLEPTQRVFFPKLVRDMKEEVRKILSR